MKINKDINIEKFIRHENNLYGTEFDTIIFYYTSIIFSINTNILYYTSMVFGIETNIYYNIHR